MPEWHARHAKHTHAKIARPKCKTYVCASGSPLFPGKGGLPVRASGLLARAEALFYANSLSETTTFDLFRIRSGSRPEPISANG